MHERFDAVIVGAGPAGAVTALRLAELGWRTALVERGPRYRDKTCGHCLHSRGLDVLRRLGLLDAVCRLAVGQTHALRVHGLDGTALDAELGEGGGPVVEGGLLVERHRFDQMLIDHATAAGARIFQPASARIVSHGGDGVEIEVAAAEQRQQLHTSLLIGADGVGSMVARAAGLASDARIGRKYGFSFDLPAADAAAIAPGWINMFVVPGGYMGVVAQETEVLHIAGLVSAKIDADLRSPLAFARLVAQQFEPLRRIGLHQVENAHVQRLIATGPMPWRPRRIANHHAALVGDAAGYVEPFTGEGMTWAMHSADVLANVLAQAKPGAWNSRLARHYAHAWQNQIGRGQRACRLLTFALARQRVTKWLLRAGARYPAVTRRIVRQVVSP